jgi:hypothetical protein
MIPHQTRVNHQPGPKRLLLIPRTSKNRCSFTWEPAMDTLKRDVGRPGSIEIVSTLKNAATEALAPEESGGSEPPSFECQVRFRLFSG